MPSSPVAAARKRRPRGMLSPDRILDAAMGIIESDGSDALTFRRLGTELGVDHTAVLRHFRGKDELMLALADRLLAEALEGVEVSDDWRATLTDLAQRVRLACRAHPQLAVVVSGRTTRRTSEFQGAEIVIGALLRAGLEGREAASCYRALVAVALSYASVEATVMALPSEARAGDREAWSNEYLALSPTRYPSIAAVAAHLADVDEDDQFDLILELFLDAIEVRAKRR
ncbi:TetR/AcrR family transcriptional regulator [Nocardia farcinica]|uniref:TetR/AcrR family transcriptional regulator n=1 Tax=Nocardia farcinica TaxID=37329 RepID=UPI001B3C9EBC|nr:TetR/AcrR family transcriptional regulator [Nocardia farcinica]MBF6537187.1 TetR/AcrR family transcriptional regulator C-terminal domain-containing protein [Nocardia farcinica]